MSSEAFRNYGMYGTCRTNWYGIWYDGDGDGDDGSLKVIYIYMPIRRTRFPVLIPVYCTLLIPVPLLLLPSLPPSPIAE